MINAISGISFRLFIRGTKILNHSDGCEPGVNPRSLKKSMFVRSVIYGQYSYLKFPSIYFVVSPFMLNTVLFHEEVNGGKSKVNL